MDHSGNPESETGALRCIGWILGCFLVPPHPLAQGLPGNAGGWEPDAWEGLVTVCCWLQEWLLCYPDGALFFIIFLTSVVHLSMARITIPRGITGWYIDDARWGKAPLGTFQIKQLSVYDTVIWRWFTRPPLPSGCHLPSLHCWALRLGCSLTT